MKAALFPNFRKTNALSCTVAVCRELERLHIEIWASLNVCQRLKSRGIDTARPVISDAEENGGWRDGSIFSGEDDTARETAALAYLAKRCDVIIAIGGDGTILRCAQAAKDTPILGVNSGRMGFMASVEPDELSLLSRLAEGAYTIRQRMMLAAEHVAADGTVSTPAVHALNDVILSGQCSRLNDFTVYADGQLVSATRADGVVFSTPTGSTAYAFSAGGPLVEPEMSCISFTPICPHSLFSRTMLFAPERVLTVRSDRQGQPMAYMADGQKAADFMPGDLLRIWKSDRVVRLIDLKENNFYNAVHHKLTQSIKGAGI